MLTREELDKIALVLWGENADSYAHPEDINRFAHALLVEVQKRLDVPVYWNGKLNFAMPWELIDKERSRYAKDCTIKLTTLPLVEKQNT